LLSNDQKEDFLKGIRTEYAALKAGFENRKAARTYLPYSEAKKNKVKIGWGNYVPVTPAFLGTKVFDSFDLGELRHYIDWKPFFIAWEMHGNFPDILKDARIGAEATKLYNDANALLDKIIAEQWLTAKGVIGFWEATSDGDEVEVRHQSSSVKLEFLRQQVQKSANQPNFSLADFIVPKGIGKKDFIGAFAVTLHGIERHVKAFEAAHDDYNKIMLQALADRFAEAFAECLHEKVRQEFWGYSGEERLTKEDLLKENYVGIRPAPGYPACPDHTEKYKLFELLNATDATGITLTESLAMFPASSVCGWYFSHPQSQYFGVGKIQRDQLEDYARRKSMSMQELERWLSPILD
jgi:5-methyltetrahydrofolate--homocysteine methyltransferase